VIEKAPKPRGGARPGAGRPKGLKLQTTIVKEAIARKAYRNQELSGQNVLNELSLHAFGSMQGLFDTRGKLKPAHVLTAEEAAIIASFDVKRTPGDSPDELTRVRMVDKTKSLELLAKHFALLNEEPKLPQVVVLVGQGNVSIGPNPWATEDKRHNPALSDTRLPVVVQPEAMVTRQPGDAQAGDPPTPIDLNSGERIRTGTQPGSRPVVASQFSEDDGA
jgi:hypothetical protein